MNNPIDSFVSCEFPSKEILADGLAFKLCEDAGCDDPHQLIWEGQPPEPWGEVWQEYLSQAREYIEAAFSFAESVDSNSGS